MAGGSPDPGPPRSPGIHDRQVPDHCAGGAGDGDALGIAGLDRHLLAAAQDADAGARGCITWPIEQVVLTLVTSHPGLKEWVQA